MNRHALLAVVAVVASASACLDPLPQASECVEPAQIVVDDVCLACPLAAPVPYERCVPQAFLGGEPLGVGCLAQHGEFWRFACLVGPDAETECACDESSPKSEGPACFESACPPRVNAVAPDAGCIRDDLSVEYVAADLLPGCTCRCASELLRCDGKGVSFGAITDATTEFGLPYVTMILPADLPSTGRLGVYVRMRGFAAPMVVAVNNPRAEGLELVRSYAFFGIGEYAEFIGLGAKEDGINLAGLDEEPYSWASDDDKPKLLVISPGPLDGDGGLHISEVDCVIPFVLPL